MGEIFIEGIGLVDIEGDIPNEAEQKAILEAIGTQPGPVGPRMQAAPRGPEPAREGPAGLVPSETRQAIRQGIEDQPGLLGFLAEMTPATIGAAAGVGLTAPIPIPGARVAGGIVGGLIGEAIGQETGVAPESRLNMALAGAGPLAGRGAAAVARGAGRLPGKAIEFVAPTRVALSKTRAKQATARLQRLGMTILGKGKESASQLFTVARKSGVELSGRMFTNTRKALSELTSELKPLVGFAEVDQALKVIQSLGSSLRGQRVVTKLTPEQLNAFEKGAPGITRIGPGGATQFVIDEPIAFDTVISVRQQLGKAIEKAQNAAGVRFGSAKKAFAAMSDDLDNLAAGAAGAERAGITQIAKAATRRAKLEFAVRDLEGMFSRFTKISPEGDMVIDPKAMLKRVIDVTNSKSKDFDKNFTSALGSQVDDLKKNLAELVRNTKQGSPGGPASLVIRGRLVGMVTGGLAGFGLEGPMTGAFGAMAGASLPEMLTGVFLSRPGAAFLTKAATLGRGEVNFEAWTVLGQIMTRLGAETREK